MKAWTISITCLPSNLTTMPQAAAGRSVVLDVSGGPADVVACRDAFLSSAPLALLTEAPLRQTGGH